MMVAECYCYKPVRVGGVRRWRVCWGGRGHRRTGQHSSTPRAESVLHPLHNHTITSHHCFIHACTYTCMYIYVQYSCTVLPCLVVLWSHWYMYVIAGDRVYSPAQCVSVWPPSMYTTAAQTQGRSQDMGPCVCDVHVHVLQCLKT